MHETLSKHHIGYIDSVQQKDGYCHIKGWVVDNSDKETSIVTRGMFHIEREERSDVASFYKSTEEKYLNCGFKLILNSDEEFIPILINDELVFKIKNELTDKILKPNLKTKPELIVVDNFYSDPDAVRKFAMSQEFVAQEQYHKGKRTVKSFIPSWIKGEFEKYLTRPIKEFVGATGVFQYCIAKDQVVYHYDMQEYAAMVYLSPNAPLETGTSTFRSKINGMTHAATEEEALKRNMSVIDLNAQSFNGNNFYDKTNMELMDSVANVYNRMVIFNARALHAASGYYGTTMENGRLFHLFFFN